MYSVTYDQQVLKKDISKIPKSNLAHIRLAIDRKLKVDPIRFGKPLKYDLSSTRSLRCENYRVLYQIFAEEGIVHVIAIAHRSDVYKT